MQNGKDVHVLVVDDELDTLKANAVILKMLGVNNIVLESDSRRVLEILNAGGIDVVVLDLVMPHLSGLDLLPRLRELHPEVPVIIVTANYELEQAVECNPRLRRYQHNYGLLIENVDDYTLLRLGEIAGRIDARHQALFPHDAEVPAYS